MAIVFFDNTETGVANFSGQQLAFIEALNINLMGSNVIAVITAYSYTAEGAAHDVLLQLSPSSSSEDHEKIELENLTGITSFTVACEFPVPKSAAGVSFVALFTTSNGKNDDATLRITYEIRTY